MEKLLTLTYSIIYYQRLCHIIYINHPTEFGHKNLTTDLTFMMMMIEWLLVYYQPRPNRYVVTPLQLAQEGRSSSYMLALLDSDFVDFSGPKPRFLPNLFF